MVGRGFGSWISGGFIVGMEGRRGIWGEGSMIDGGVKCIDGVAISRGGWWIGVVFFGFMEMVDGRRDWRVCGCMLGDRVGANLQHMF